MSLDLCEYPCALTVATDVDIVSPTSIYGFATTRSGLSNKLKWSNAIPGNYNGFFGVVGSVRARWARAAETVIVNISTTIVDNPVHNFGTPPAHSNSSDGLFCLPNI
jgi:hypothetical protein